MKNSDDDFDELLDFTTLKPFKNRLAGNLSGGMKQKLALACAMLSKPKLLILDEPTRGIDVGTKSEIQKLVIDLAKQGKSIMFISSEISEMLRTCNRMVIMRDGEKVGEVGGDITEQKVMHAIAGGGESE
mgnify:CR=1 FL=1